MSKPRRQSSSTVTAAVIYLRVSTQGQAESGLGREAQEALCRAYAERQGWPVVAVHVDDGISGTLGTSDRPGLAAAIAACHAHPGSVFLVASVSRVSRSQRGLWELLDERGSVRLPLVSASEPFDVSTSMGRAFLGMLATFASLESDLASDRTVAALGAAKARGMVLGPLRMTESLVDGQRVADPAKVALVARVQRLGALGHSGRKIADLLNAEGVKTATGKRWHPRTVRVALAIRLDGTAEQPTAAAE